MQRFADEHVVLLLVLALFFPIGFLLGRQLGTPRPVFEIVLGQQGTVTPAPSSSAIEALAQQLERTSSTLSSAERTQLVQELRTLAGPTTRIESRTQTVLPLPAPSSSSPRATSEAPSTTTTTALLPLPKPAPGPQPPQAPKEPCPFSPAVVPFCDQAAALTDSH